ALLVLGSTVIGLLALELGVRLVRPSRSARDQLARAARLPPPRDPRPCVRGQGEHWGAFVQPSDDPAMIFELKPDADGCWDYYGLRIRTNHAGQRSSRDYARPKPPGTLRIVGLGDSLMFGYGVEYEQTYAHLLEEELTKRLGRPVEFVDLAVGGYN